MIEIIRARGRRLKKVTNIANVNVVYSNKKQERLDPEKTLLQQDLFHSEDGKSTRKLEVLMK